MTSSSSSSSSSSRKSDVHRLGDLLVTDRIITSEQLDQGLHYQDETGVRLGEGLVRLGFLPRPQLDALLRRQGEKNRIGERLLAAGLISAPQLSAALEDQKRHGTKLGQSLERLGILAEKTFLTFLARQLALPFVDLGRAVLDPEVVQQLPEAMARRYRAIVLEGGTEDRLIGMSDPTDLLAYDQLVKRFQVPIRTALVSERSLLRIFDLTYRKVAEMNRQVARLEEEVGEYHAVPLSREGAEVGSDAPVVRIINSLFDDALRLNASDIHIEPDAEVLRIRQRIDGRLVEQVIKERRIAPALISKLKLMAGLEIAEKRLPQDGRFQMVVRGRTLDVRLSTLPIQDGESVVLRLLDSSGDHLNLAMVGMEPDILARFQHQIQRSQGLILVTGPTGSGKTTTLYGALNHLNRPEYKIITVEEPVEYRISRINQVQVHAKIGLTYGEILRRVLRQDPDIILVGEMRDKETAQMAIRAALTGHLVFSTLHTISAISTTVRLIEMGIEGYAVASALRAVLSQRLVRRICDYCAVPFESSREEEAVLRACLRHVKPEPTRLRQGAGCSHCNHTGFLGRIAVVELLEMNRALADALRREDLAEFGALARRRSGYVPLPISALTHARRGVILLEEALHLLRDAEEEPLVPE